VANRRILVLGVVLIAACVGGYLLWRPVPAAPLSGVVRATEVRVAPEVGGQLAAIKVEKGARVRSGDVVAELSADELTAAVAQARAALDAATANRNNVYAGVRAEQIAALAAETAKAKSRLDYAEQQLNRTTTLARSDTATQQALDQAAVLERHLGKTVLRSPVDGVVSVIVAGLGENVRAGQPVLAIAADGKQWLSFNAREDLLRGLTVGTTVQVVRAGARETMPAVVTELRPLGVFATWQAERAVGDHDRNTLRLRLDPQSGASDLEPGMTVWIAR